MKLLVINTGSSSIKYQLFRMDNSGAPPGTLALGLIEKIGDPEGMITYEKYVEGERPLKKRIKRNITDHLQGLKLGVDLLMDEEHGIIKDISEISVVGHRVVHGGETFHAPTIIDSEVIKAIKENIPLAPLHNPPNIIGIEVALSIFPDSPQVAVFDTAFHQTIPMKAFLYALPYELYSRHRVRRYGFHGTSHSYVADESARFLGSPLKELNIITVHLGNGASMAAINKGKCVDTSMGMTPLEGLVMGTRSGNIDPAIPFFMANHLKMSFKEIDELLNKESGLKGLCNINDMREVIEKSGSGDSRAQAAIEVYCYRIKKYIGSYFAALGHVDCITFTAGVGENSPKIREMCCKGLEGLGIETDNRKNSIKSKEPREISSSNSRVKVLVVPTNEELRIAIDTKRVIERMEK